VPEAARIPRRQGVRTNEVQAFITAGALPEDSLEAATALMADFELPSGYTLEIGGESAERDDAMGNLASSMGILVVLMAATLVLSFQSFRMSAIIAGVAALSVGLAMGALWITGHPFGFMAIVGTMGLMGIAINDSIVVLAALRGDERARSGELRGIVDVVVRSTRHVLSTTVTTVAGFIPLLMETEGLWPPLAVSIAGGVVGATLLALTFVPGLYALSTRRRSEVAALVPAPA
jgi:multidrug efflux pump subunit AcrB